MQRRKEENHFVNRAGPRPFLGKPKFNKKSSLPFASLLLCVFALNLFSLSCTTKPSDLRTLVPAETLVYLETNDLAAALQPVVDSKPFSSVVTKKPDFSALKGVQVAVAVTGFETSEVAVTDEQAVGKVQPRFVAVADTHAWNYQAVAFAEKKLGSFVTEIYDAEPKLEKSDKHGGKYFTWTSQDGRKAFALVIDSLIYFGNDESAIDKALSVRNGQTDSIAKTGKLPPHVPGNLASGYVSTDGVAQIAALAGLHFASQASDEEEVQSAVAGILPQLIRGAVTDITWSTSQTSEGIEDKWSVKMPTEQASILADVLRPSEKVDDYQLERIPKDFTTATKYDIANDEKVWDVLVSLAQKHVSQFEGEVIREFSNLVVEPYGIADPSGFLAQVHSPIIIVQNDKTDSGNLVISISDHGSSFREVLLKDFNWETQGESLHPGILWKSKSGDYALAFLQEWIALTGDTEAVSTCAKSPKQDPILREERFFQSFIKSKATVTTLGRDAITPLPLINILAREGHGDTQVVSTYLTETRFTKTGMERRTVSDFGFIGWMIGQLAAE